MPDTSVPPGTYAGGARSPIAWVYLCPSCGGYAPSEDGSSDLSRPCQGCGSGWQELHRFQAVIDSAAGCGCRGSHPRVTGDLVAARSRSLRLRAELDRINDILRENGYDYPLGARGVSDMADHRAEQLDELVRFDPEHWAAPGRAAGPYGKRVAELERQLAAVTGDLAAAGSAAELVRWMHAEAARMEAASSDSLSPDQRAVLDAFAGAAGKGPLTMLEGKRAELVVLEGQRAHQAQLARSLTAAVACIAVMRPELTASTAPKEAEDA